MRRVANIGDVAVSQTDFEQLMTRAKTHMEASGMSVPENVSEIDVVYDVGYDPSRLKTSALPAAGG